MMAKLSTENCGGIKVFISYAHEDEPLRRELDTHLGALENEGIIRIWSDHDIVAGSDWSEEILRELEAAELILLLISPDFLRSTFGYGEEGRRAIERHKSRTARVVPIMLRSCAWDVTSFANAKIQGVPRGMKPVADYPRHRRDKVWSEVAKSVCVAAKLCAARRERVTQQELADADEIGHTPNIERYLPLRAAHYRHFLNPPVAAGDLSVGDREHVADLRAKLLLGVELPQPKLLTVQGTLFPCALLNSGWWDHHEKKVESRICWRNEVQEWLFNGFDLWAPSWDFTWTLDAEEQKDRRPHFIAQLGSGDEADSLPVIIPQLKAQRLREEFQQQRGGLEAEVTGLLGRRNHFCWECKDLEVFGGLLDYCIWLDDENVQHKIKLRRQKPGLYSGYLWKCLAPRALTEARKRLYLEDVYCVWEHTNFASADAVRYGLDALEHKEDYIRSMHGDLVLIQKSSSLVPGSPMYSSQKAYDIIVGNPVDEI